MSDREETERPEYSLLRAYESKLQQSFDYWDSLDEYCTSNSERDALARAKWQLRDFQDFLKENGVQPSQD